MRHKVRFADLSVQDADEQKELHEALTNVLAHGRLILGPEVAALEEKIAAICGRKFAVGVASGTSAIVLALRALEIGPGDRVVTSALSWLASGTSISLVGAEPVFADVREDFNIDPDALEMAIDSRCKAILPVNYAGKICDYSRILNTARVAGIPTIEDASQSIGALRGSQPAGSYGLISVISLNPMKIFGGLGEAGMVLTDDPTLNDRIRTLRYHGMTDSDRTQYFSGNERIDTLQAAFLLRRLPALERRLEARRLVAARYKSGLKDIVRTPEETTIECSRDSWFVYPILTEACDKLAEYLSEMGIEARKRESIALPDQPVFSHLPPSDTPKARQLVKEMLCLPMHDKLSNIDVNYVIETVQSFFRRNSK